jgi:isoleucyl-tRNA synthetase
MSRKFPEYQGLNLSQINKDILKYWEEDNTFDKSISTRENQSTFVFYEGPPSANGKPGIHHVMARTIKDIFCRYKTLKGFRVDRKAGWDTHGLPVELGVEKSLNITKEDIGKKISIAEYNAACRKDVMKYTDLWEELTHLMGYWVNMDDPYITYDNRYIETLWNLLSELFKKDLLYKGYTIQPFSPAAGTGLSSHELNQPGCYRDVKDTTCIGQFKVVKDSRSEELYADVHGELFFLAWTTTPWTLPSNTALAVGSKISYVKVKTFNQYTGQAITVILARDLFSNYFSAKNEKLKLEDYNSGDKQIPFLLAGEYKGSDLTSIRYEQLIPWVKPKGDAFKVISGDFVTTEDGTGIVHIAPTFGADDDRVARQNGISPLILIDKAGKNQPMVDRSGKFFRIDDLDDNFVNEYVHEDSYGDFAGRFVKNEYDSGLTKDDATLDVDIAVMLKLSNKAFKIEKHVHNYPHCWRTDKPVLYYPLDSWFIKTTAVKERLLALNDTINWKPKSTGTGRFGKWLENLVDWNLSRSRYWGTPLPLWVTEDNEEITCIGSVEQLKSEIDKSIEAGFMKENPMSNFTAGDFSDENYGTFDLHRPMVDDIVLVSPKGEKMLREPDLIDVWFDSGAMPFAQVHYPFENKESFDKVFPADFIAEGVDQTRGWFFTLHAISTMISDSVSFKNIISNGLVLDKKGNKMSKRLDNAVDPFETIEKYGSDPLRWYMITNAQPWDNLKFDIDGIDEVRRKFFGTLYNTYSFFSLYANVDGFVYEEQEIPFEERPELDRWVLSLLNSLIKEVEESLEDYSPTRAGRAISNFVTENLSNWYVRLSRKRFWGGEYSKDKISAYQTLYQCLETVAILASPIAPFYADKLFLDLNKVSGRNTSSSVHLIEYPTANEGFINPDLEQRMDLAQKISSMILGLRRKVNLKVRQPLGKIMVPVSNEKIASYLKQVESIILSEVNVKELELLTDSSGIFIKKIKPNFKVLGKRFGKLMKNVSGIINGLGQDDIQRIETEGSYKISIDGEEHTLSIDDVEIITEDIPGWLVSNEGSLTVALDINVTDQLRAEGIAREFVNRIQNLRKDSGFEVTDKISISIQKHEAINAAIEEHGDYICTQTLATGIELVELIENKDTKEVELEKDVKTYLKVSKVS